MLTGGAVKPGQVEVSQLGDHAKHMSPSMGWQDSPAQPARPAMLWRPARDCTSPSRGPFVVEDGLGGRKRFGLFLQRPPAEQHSLLWEPEVVLSHGPRPGFLLWLTKCLPAPRLHLYYCQEHQRVMAGCITPMGKFYPN